MNKRTKMTAAMLMVITATLCLFLEPMRLDVKYVVP
jgi:hypothetical protein